MKRYKISGLILMLIFLSNYDKSQNATISSTRVDKTVQFHHFDLYNYTFMHSSDWHYSIHKTNAKIYKVLNNPIPVHFHFVTGDLVDSKSRDGLTSHQYKFEEDQVKQVLTSYTVKNKQLNEDFESFFTVLGNHDIYDTLDNQKKREHHIITTPQAKLVMLDTGPFGLGRPLNFFGFIDDLVLELIEMSLGNTPIIIMAHYPLSTTFYSKKLLDLLKNYPYPVYYLCGHLHYFIKPFGYHLKTLYNGLIELEVGDVKEHAASRLFHVSDEGITFADVDNHNYTNAIIISPLNHRYLINDPPEWDKCIKVKNFGAHTLHLFTDNDHIFTLNNATDTTYIHCITYIPKSITLKAVGATTFTQEIYLYKPQLNELKWVERWTYWTYSFNYADGFLNSFYFFYFLQFIFIFSLLFSKGKFHSHWLSFSAIKHTYSQVWIVFLITSISFLFMPLFYGSFAKDNLRCSVFEAPFYPFGTRYNHHDVFQFDFLIWVVLFLYYENFILFFGFHIHNFRSRIQQKWITKLAPALVIYIKWYLLKGMFTWYIYEDRDCFSTNWLYYLWNAFGFLQLFVMPVSWIFLRYLYFIITNKLSIGFRPKDL